MGIHTGVFNPEELVLLKSVLEAAAAALPVADQTSEAKTVLAQKIIACASAGERDPIRLRTKALMQFRTEAIGVIAPGADAVPWKF